MTVSHTNNMVTVILDATYISNSNKTAEFSSVIEADQKKLALLHTRPNEDRCAFLK